MFTSVLPRPQVTQVPYMVTLNQDMYVQVNLRGDDSGLVLFLDTCVASPSPHDFQNNTYALVRNGYAPSSQQLTGFKRVELVPHI